MEKKLSFDYQLSLSPPPPLSAEEERQAEYRRAILGMPSRPRPILSLSLVETTNRVLDFTCFEWHSLSKTNFSQSDRSANGSQPIRSETNRTSTAAGSGH
jgi:hypothetical protein